MGKKTPEAPNYEGAADKQLETGKELIDDQTKANRPTQETPWGKIEWTQDEDGNWTQNTTLNDSQQGALDQQQQMQNWRSQMANGMFGQVGDAMGQPMDWSQFQDFGQAPQAFDPSSTGQFGDYSTTAPDMSGLQDFNSANEYQKNAEQSLYDRSAARLDPRFAQEKESLEVSLRNRGLSEGDAAFDSAMQNYDQNKNDAYSSAQNDAMTGSGAEASRMFEMDAAKRAQQYGEQMGLSDNEIKRMEQQFQQQYQQNQQGMYGQNQGFNQGMQGANYNNQLRQQQIQQEMLKRGMPLNEMNQLLGGQQVTNPQFGGFSQSGVAQVPDYLGALMGQSNFNQGQAQSGMGGIGSMLGMAGSMMGMFSDRRLKKDIKKIGELWGYNLYSFTYLWGVDSIGFMADELNPEAVTRLDSGYDYVNLSEVTPCKIQN